MRMDLADHFVRGHRRCWTTWLCSASRGQRFECP